MNQPAQQFDEKTLTEIQDAAYNMGVQHCISLIDDVDLFWDDSPRSHKDKIISKLEALKKTNQ